MPNHSDSRREARGIGKHCSTFENNSVGQFRRAANIDWLEKTMTRFTMGLMVEKGQGLREHPGLFIYQLCYMLVLARRAQSYESI